MTQGTGQSVRRYETTTQQRDKHMPAATNAHNAHSKTSLHENGIRDLDGPPTNLETTVMPKSRPMPRGVLKSD